MLRRYYCLRDRRAYLKRELVISIFLTELNATNLLDLVMFGHIFGFPDELGVLLDLPYAPLQLAVEA